MHFFVFSSISFFWALSWFLVSMISLNRYGNPVNNIQKSIGNSFCSVFFIQKKLISESLYMVRWIGMWILVFSLFMIFPPCVFMWLHGSEKCTMGNERPSDITTKLLAHILRPPDIQFDSSRLKLYISFSNSTLYLSSLESSMFGSSFQIAVYIRKLSSTDIVLEDANPCPDGISEMKSICIHSV